MLNLTFAVLDITLAIILLFLGTILMPKIANHFGYKLIVFRVEKITQEEIYERIKSDLESLKTTEEIMRAKK